MSTWKVGDPVIIDKARLNRYTPNEPEYGTVTKVARKYFHVRTELVRDNFSGTGTYAITNDYVFEIATGIQKPTNPDYTSYLDHAYTPQQWEAKQYRDRVEARLREDHRVFGGNSDSTLCLHHWSDGELLELVELLDRVKARRDQKDLDR